MPAGCQIRPKATDTTGNCILESLGRRLNEEILRNCFDIVSLTLVILSQCAPETRLNIGQFWSAPTGL